MLLYELQGFMTFLVVKLSHRGKARENRPDSLVGRAFAFRAGSNPVAAHKGVKYGTCTSSSLAETGIKTVVLGRLSKVGKSIFKILLCRRIARELMLSISL